MRGLVMFPKMVLHFDVARKKSILALNQAMQGNQKIFLVTQKNTRVENPGKDDLYTVGVVAKVKQILKAQSEVMRVVVEGQYRARMCELVKDTPFYEVMCEEIPMLPVEQGKQVTIDAYMRVVKDLFEEYCYYAPKMPKELVVNIIGSEDPVYISEYLAQNLGFSIEDKQMILEESSIRKRMEILSSLLRRENEILSIERSIAERVKEQVDRNQKEYYLREQLKAIHAELGEDEDSDQEIEQYRQKLKEMAPDEETEKKLTEEINKLSKMMYNSQEAMVSRNYLDTVFSLPWNHMTQERLDIHQAQEQLDADHYGLQKVKERILEILAVLQAGTKHQRTDHLSGGSSRCGQDLDCKIHRRCNGTKLCPHESGRRARRGRNPRSPQDLYRRDARQDCFCHQAGGQHEPADAVG